PNYVLPAFAPVALLTGRFLDRWRSGALDLPAWVMHAGFGLLALLGVGVALGLLLAGGAIQTPLARGRSLPGLEVLAAVGILPVLGAAAAAWWAARRQRGRVAAAVAATAVAFTGTLAAWGAAAVDAHKAPRALVEAYHLCQRDRDVRVACHQYFQPSLVFY